MLAFLTRQGRLWPLLLWVLMTPAMAQTPLQIQQLQDPTGSLSVEYVQRHLDEFRKLPGQPWLGRSGDVLWLQLEAFSQQQRGDQLVVRQPLLDRITLYGANGQGHYRLIADHSESQGPISRLTVPTNHQSALLLRLQSSSWGSAPLAIVSSTELGQFDHWQTVIVTTAITLLMILTLTAALTWFERRHSNSAWLCAAAVTSSAALLVNTTGIIGGLHWLPFASLMLLLASVHGIVHGLSHQDSRSLAFLLLPLCACLMLALVLPILPALARQVGITATMAMFTLLWWLQLKPQRHSSARLVLSAACLLVTGVLAWQASLLITQALSLWPTLILASTLVISFALIMASHITEAYVRFKTHKQRSNARHVKLRDEIERLRLINQSQNHFLATISHEFRGPLNGILGSIENALSQPSHQRREELLDARSSAEEVLDLVNQILTHTELESGYHPLILDDISLQSLLEPIQQQLQSGCDRKGLELIVDISQELPERMRLDAPCIRQALRALADNALRLTQQGRIWLKARPCAIRGESGMQLTLEDEGPGLNQHELQRWQEYFHQAQGTPAYQDLQAPPGMGLALVKAACYSLRGDFLVESRAKGLSVSLAFPAIAAARTADTELDTLTHNTQVTTLAPGQRGRILVVEDNTINQRVIKTMLERLQFDVDLADNGERALERLSNNNGQRYQLIFMDCEMPGMDGYTATRRIRESHWPESICPIVAVTAHALPGDRQRCLEAGMNDYMSKPINMQQLRLMIGRWSARLPDNTSNVTEHPSSRVASSNKPS